MTNYKLKSVIIDGLEYQYFYFVEKLYSNGTGRYRVFTIDPDAPAVYETVFKCYHYQIPEKVIAFIELAVGVTVPF